MLILYPMVHLLEKLRIRWCVALLVLLAAALHVLALPKITAQGVYPDRDETAIQNVLMPDFAGHGRGDTFTYVFHIDYQAAQQSIFGLYPHGCVTSISINGKTDLPYAMPNCAGWLSGTRLDLAGALEPGNNEIRITVNRLGLQFGPMIFTPHHDHLTDWIAFAMILLCVALLMLLTKRYTHEVMSGAILSIGLLIYLYLFHLTGFMQYTIDMPGHIEYILLIARNGHWPKPYLCWECYHPPLYYTLEAAVVWCANQIGSFDTVSLMRLFSLGCFMSFLFVTALTLKRLLQHRFVYYCVLLLLVCYPSGIYFAARLDSNLMFYPLYVSCLYFAVRWLESNQLRHLVTALVVFGITLATRTNALILLPLLGLAVLYRWHGNRRLLFQLLRSRWIWCAVLVIALGASVNFGRSIYYHIVEGRHESILVSNAHRLTPARFGVENSLPKLLTLDVENYFDQPFWNSVSDRSGRQYFWNSLLKSSLFIQADHYRATGDMGEAKTLTITLALMLLYIANSIILCAHSLKRKWQWWASIAALAIPIAMLMMLRLRFPLGSSEDFRYIYPSLGAFCAIIGMLIEQHIADKRHAFVVAGMMLCVFFAYKSVTFVL